MKAPDHICVVGIDEMTAIYSDDLNTWKIHGIGKMHLLKGKNPGVYAAGDYVTISA